MSDSTLEILVLANGRKYKILANSPWGKEEETVDASLLRNVRGDLSKLRDALRFGALTRRSPDNNHALPSQLAPGSDEQMVQEMGGNLFSFLFAGDIATLYRKSLKEALDSDAPLRVKLRVDEVRELSTYPWETLYDSKTRSYLATQQNLLFSRAVDADDSAIRKRDRLHILGMIAAPTKFEGSPLGIIDAVKELGKIENATKQLKEADKLRLSWTISGSYNDFRKRLRVPDNKRDAWTIFHFIGHGDFDEDTNEGYLIFEEEGGSDGEARYAETLLPLLTAPKGPQLVVLNACNGALSGGGDIFSSTAARLALGGVPAVIAMQFPVSDDMAIRFSERFYTYLADEDGRYSIPEALALTRLDLLSKHIAEWVSPVLFMQSADGQLLKF